MAIGTAAALIGSAIIGGISSSNAASKASHAQQKSADQSIAFQKESRDLALGYQKPFRDASYGALSAMQDMVGLPHTGDMGTMQGTAGGPMTGEYLPRGSGFRGMFQGGDPRGGRMRIPSPVSASKPAGKYQFTADPGYAFRLAEGNKAITRSAAAGPGLLSGRYVKSALRYAQDYASNEYQNVYNRIATLAGFGSQAAGNSSQIAYGTGANIAQTMTNAADARASGYVAQGNSWANAMNQIGQWAGQRPPPVVPSASFNGGA